LHAWKRNIGDFSSFAYFQVFSLIPGCYLVCGLLYRESYSRSTVSGGDDPIGGFDYSGFDSEMQLGSSQAYPY